MSGHKVDCLEFRRLTLTDPNDGNDERIQHADGCERCSAFAIAIDLQEELTREATQIEVPDGFAARILLNQSLHSKSRRPTRWYWLSLAASLLLGFVLYFLAAEQSTHPVEAELIAHFNAHDVLDHHLHSGVTDTSEIQQVLAAVDTALPMNTDNVFYAATCVIQGEVMAHLVVENGDDQYVVFLIPQNSMAQRPYQSNGWSVQTAHLDSRGIAVMGRGDMDLQHVTSSFFDQFKEPLGSGTTI